MNTLPLRRLTGTLTLLATIVILGTWATASEHASAALQEGSGMSAPTIPAWFLATIEQKTRNGGRWIADNSEYREADGDIEAYGIHWIKGIGGKSMIGRLYSLRGGEELATHWEFRAFWHPVDKAALVYQFGVDGTLGWGEMHQGDGLDFLEQTFAGPDGAVTRIRHESRVTGDRDFGRSFDWKEGKWEPRRAYTWVLQR